ncbi:MAG: hypothetical protein HC915_11265 [Anaerolineae bacterium]|nr:hypothetical protein [Anaerolineae bacterium]
MEGNLAPQASITSPRGVELARLALPEEASQAASTVFTIRETGFQTLTLDAELRGRNESPSQYQLLLRAVRATLADGGLLRTAQRSAIGATSTLDSWYFEGQAGEQISLDLIPLGELGPTPLELQLADTGGQVFARTQSSISTARLALQNIMLPRSGIYQVIVRGGTSRSGTYHLNFQRDFSYLQASESGLHVGQTVNGVLTQAQPINRWIIPGNPGDVLALALRPTLGDVADLAFQLQDARGTVLGTGLSDPGMGIFVEGIVIPETGLYTLSVGVPSESFEGEAAYQLSLELQNRGGVRSAGDLIPYNSEQTGTLYADDETDLWVFSGQAGDVISIEIAGDGILQPSLTLLSADAPLIDAAEVIRTGTESRSARLVSYTLPASGIYGVVVQGVASTTGHYRLTLTAENQVGISPRPLLPGEIDEASLPIGETQAWELTLSRPGRISAAVLPLQRSSDFSAELRVVAPSGAVLAQGRASLGEVATVADVPALESGVYLLQVRSWIDDPLGTTARYSIQAELATVDIPLEAAQPLAVEDTAIGVLSDTNPRDLWSFSGVAGEVIRLTAARTSGNLDPQIALWAPDGMLLGTADDNTDSQNSDLTLVLPTEGQYQVQVARFGGERGATGGNYLLSLTRNFQPGALTQVGEALIPYGSRLVDTFDPLEAEVETVKRWYFLGAQGDRINATLQFPTDDRPLSLFIADGAGNLYRQAERVNDQARLQNFVLPSDGLYQLIVQRPQDARVREFHPYSLSLELAEGQLERYTGATFLEDGSNRTLVMDTTQQTHLWLYQGRAGDHLRLLVSPLEDRETLPIDLVILTPDGSTLLNQPQQAVLQAEVALPQDGLYQIFLLNQAEEAFRYRLAVVGIAGSLTPVPLQTDTLEFGRLTSAEPQQAWTFEGRAGESVRARAEVLTGTLQLDLRLEGPQGTLLARSTPDVQNAQISLLPRVVLPEDGLYQLVIMRQGNRLATTTGTYQLLVSTAPNNESAEADRSLPIGGTTLGAVDGTRSVTYAFLGDPRAPLSINVIPQDAETLPTLQVTDELGHVIAVGMGTLPNLLVPQEGLYRLTVAHPTPLSFTLTASRRVPAPQPREIRREVNLLDVLSSEAPSNTWSFEAAAGEILVFELLTFGAPVQPDVLLFGPDGLPLQALVQLEATGSFTFGPVVTPEAGRYLLRIGTWLDNLATEINYSMRVTAQPPTSAFAPPGGIIFASEAYRFVGAISTATPENTWRFWAEAGTQLVLVLSGEEAAPPAAELFDPGLSVVELATVPGADDGQTRQNALLPEAGWYTLIFRRSADRGTDSDALQLYRGQLRLQDRRLEDIFAQAQGVQIGGPPIEGQLEGANSLATYVFLGNSGENIAADLQPLPEGNRSVPELTLIGPDGMALRSTRQGGLSWLVQQTGVYALVVSTNSTVALPYQLTLRYAPPQADFSAPLAYGSRAEGAFASGAVLHQWRLSDFPAGLARLEIRPLSATWTALAYLLDEEGQLLSLGEPSADGTLNFEVELDATQQVQLLVASDGQEAGYVVTFGPLEYQNRPTSLPPGLRSLALLMQHKQPRNGCGRGR